MTALSSRRSYFADTEQVDIMGYNLKNRQTSEEEIFTQDNSKLFTEEVKNLKVNYLYFPIVIRPKVDLYQTPFVKIFSNSEIEIWKI